MAEWQDFLNVEISKDEMECRVFLTAGEYEDTPTVEGVEEHLQTCGIVHGILRENIDGWIHGQQLLARSVVVAKGTPPTEGKDGYYSFTFNTAPDRKPKLRDDGSVDYLNLNIIQSVEEGDLLAKYFEKVDGIAGSTVTGKELPAKPVKNMLPLRGKGFNVTEDRIEYYAAFDGKVEYSSGVLTVVRISTISGDVGLETGNLNVKGDLEIMGNVITGMDVRATGSITVRGLVEAATLKAGKEILIKGGVLGAGRAKIHAGGNVYALFVENAEIKSGDCVQADSIVNSIVNAYNDINIFGRTSAIIGGSLKATRIIRTKVIGSSAQVLTRLHVGVEASELAEIKRKECLLAEDEKEIQKIEKAMELIHQNPEESQEMLMLLTRTKIEKTTEATTLRAGITDLLNRVQLAKDAVIIAEEKAHQGTLVYIDGIAARLNSDFDRIVFVKKGDKILTKMFVEEDHEKVELMNPKF